MLRQQLVLMGFSSVTASCVSAEPWQPSEHPPHDDSAESVSSPRRTLSETIVHSARQLVVIGAERASDTCPFGGSRVASGIDLDDDGDLGAPETCDVQYLCTSNSELLGKLGIFTSAPLTRSSPEAPSGTCPEGGTRVDIGTDSNENGTFEVMETTRVAYLCGADCVVQNERLIVPANATSFGNGLPSQDLPLLPGHTALWFGFDFGDSLLNRVVISIRLNIRSTDQFARRAGAPALRIFEAATPPFVQRRESNLPRFVSAAVENVVHDGWTEIPLQLELSAFEPDALPRLYVLGLDEAITPTARPGFYDASVAATRPYIELDTLRCDPGSQGLL